MARYLLSVSELAPILGRDVSSVHRLIRDGKLPFEVIDSMGVRQVRRSDVEEFLHLPSGALAEAS
jgi:excisionase family DNA binding protein